MPRGSAPGDRRGGRKRDPANKRTLEVTERLAELGCDPIEGMARLAMDSANTPGLRGRTYSELAGFVAPKRRAVKHTEADGGRSRGGSALSSSTTRGSPSRSSGRCGSWW
jgi:hypothetical protein